MEGNKASCPPYAKPSLQTLWPCDPTSQWHTHSHACPLFGCTSASVHHTQLDMLFLCSIDCAHAIPCMTPSGNAKAANCFSLLAQHLSNYLQLEQTATRQLARTTAPSGSRHNTCKLATLPAHGTAAMNKQTYSDKATATELQQQSYSNRATGATGAAVHPAPEDPTQSLSAYMHYHYPVI